MTLAKYGYSTLGWTAVVVFVLLVAAVFVSNIYIKYPLIGIAIFLLIFSLYFFRDPGRVSPEDSNIVVSPADGRVLIVKDILEERFLKSEAQQISIFMSPLNVHVNRIPISGTVDYVKYVKGKYLAAFNDKADSENERNEIGIQTKHGKILFTQVAGFVARRIVSTLAEGDTVTMGNKFGMIKFGSRVDVIVPKSWKIKVKKDQAVTAGETILFEIPEDETEKH